MEHRVRFELTKKGRRRIRSLVSDAAPLVN